MYRDFMDKKRARNFIINTVLFTIGILIIFVMLYFIGAENVTDVIMEADPLLISLSILILLFILPIKLIRWWLLQKEANFLNASRVYLIGQAMNLFAPIGTGEVTRAAVAKAKLGIKARNTMAAVVIERISDITFLVAMAGVCIVLFIPGYRNFIFLLILVIILCIAFLLLFKPQFFDSIAIFIERLFEERGRFLTKISIKISGSITKFKGAIIQFHKRKVILGINIILTVLSWMLEAVATYTLLLAFDIANPPFIFYLLVINAMSWIARTFLFLPIGPKEVTFTLLLKNLFNISSKVGSAVALIILAMNYIVLGIGAFISVLTFSTKKGVGERARKREYGEEEDENEDMEEEKGEQKADEGMRRIGKEGKEVKERIEENIK